MLLSISSTCCCTHALVKGQERYDLALLQHNRMSRFLVAEPTETRFNKHTLPCISVSKIDSSNVMSSFNFHKVPIFVHLESRSSMDCQLFHSMGLFRSASPESKSSWHGEFDFTRTSNDGIMEDRLQGKTPSQGRPRSGPPLPNHKDIVIATDGANSASRNLKLRVSILVLLPLACPSLGSLGMEI